MEMGLGKGRRQEIESRTRVWRGIETRCWCWMRYVLSLDTIHRSLHQYSSMLVTGTDRQSVAVMVGTKLSRTTADLNSLQPIWRWLLPNPATQGNLHGRRDHDTATQPLKIGHQPYPTPLFASISAQRPCTLAGSGTRGLCCLSIPGAQSGGSLHNIEWITLITPLTRGGGEFN